MAPGPASAPTRDEAAGENLRGGKTTIAARRSVNWFDGSAGTSERLPGPADLSTTS